MFGKPQWFREKNLGWGLVPITWQGWVYSTLWGSVIVGPTIALVATKGAVESLIWMGASTAVLVWDVRKVRQELKGPVESGFPKLRMLFDVEHTEHLDLQRLAFGPKDADALHTSAAGGACVA